MPHICIHLDQGTREDYARVFTGVGTEYDLVCPECGRGDLAVITVNLIAVTAERFAEIERSNYWNTEHAIVGRPQLRERATNLRFVHELIDFQSKLPQPIVDIAPVTDSAEGACLVLDESGDVYRLDLAKRSIRRLMNCLEPGRRLAPNWSLHASLDGELAAVVETRGSYGIVLDLNATSPTMRLDRGNEEVEHSNFPIAFVVIDGKTRLLHATDWNRLDISDPRTGELLTARSLQPPPIGQNRPAHDLDYYHAGLTVSPAGNWVIDNGWVWHPRGVITTWNVRSWLQGNPWESEDGPTRKELCWRTYFWDGPLCWIDDKTVAGWGYGNDDKNLIPAVLLFDVQTGNQLTWFAGPVGKLAYDHYLFSFSPEAGASVWDSATGERLLHDVSFCPTIYHSGARHFISILPNGQLSISWLAE
jgi:hypothetical protein